MKRLGVLVGAAAVALAAAAVPGRAQPRPWVLRDFAIDGGQFYLRVPDFVDASKATLYETMWRAIQARTPDRAGPPADRIRREDSRLPAYEPIIGLEAGGATRAYPVAVLKTEQVVNDDLGGEAVLLIYAPRSDTVMVFSRSLDGRRLSFETRQPSGDLVDAQTGSRWNAHGECVEGELRGRRLEALTGMPQFWWGWAAFHADTDIYAGRGVPRR